MPSSRRGRDGDELERRAGLVGVGDRAIAPAVGARRREAVRVEARRRRHREHVARVRVHHDRRRRRAPQRSHGLCEHLLRVRLDLIGRSSGERSVPASPAFVSTTSSARPNGSFTIVWLPGLPGERPLERALEPLEALVVEPRVPEDLRTRPGPAGRSEAPPGRSRAPAKSELLELLRLLADRPCARRRRTRASDR